jgi:hypothetical protein
MTKYVVGYEEWCLFVCKTRADAEEMVLSLAEENLYENWLMDNCTDTRWEDRPMKLPLSISLHMVKTMMKWELMLGLCALIASPSGSLKRRSSTNGYRRSV